MHLTHILGTRRLGLAAGSLAFVAAGVASVSPAGAALTATVAGDTIVLHPRRKPRHGWERRFRAAPGGSDESRCVEAHQGNAR